MLHTLFLIDQKNKMPYVFTVGRNFAKDSLDSTLRSAARLKLNTFGLEDVTQKHMLIKAKQNKINFLGY